jgi:hypothetical protein
MMMRLISLCLFCLAAQVQAFGTAPAQATATRRACFAPRTGTGASLKEALRVQQSPTQLWSEPEEEGKEEAEVNPRLQGTQYPIDIPSPILLATSMILAIGSTGMLLHVV